MSSHFFNPALNMAAFKELNLVPETPPASHALYSRDGKYDGMTRAEVVASFAEFAKDPKKPLVLFFHGGLVDKKTGSKEAAAQYVYFKDVCFPYFFIWESGFAEVLAHHFPSIFVDTLFGAVCHRIRLFMGSKIGLPHEKSKTLMAFRFEEMHTETVDPLDKIELTDEMRQRFEQITLAEQKAFIQGIASDDSVKSVIGGIARRNAFPATKFNVLSEQVSSLQRDDNHYLNESVVGSIAGAYRTGSSQSSLKTVQSYTGIPLDIGGVSHAVGNFAEIVGKILWRIADRIVHHRDHGIPCTIVEEILRALYIANFGSSVWEEMKDETEATFKPDSDQYGGTAVIEELCKLVQANPQMKVTLVGHSTGGIYIGNFLRHVDIALKNQGNTTFNFDVILMAPANTMEFFSKNYQARIRALRWFSMTDDAEKNDLLISQDVGTDANASVLGRTYPRSLLYLISGILETFAPNIPSTPPHDLDSADMPVFGMDRYFKEAQLFDPNNYPEVMKTRSYFNSNPMTSRILSPTKEDVSPGQRCTAQKHGNFPSDPMMRESLRYCFEHGIG